VPLTLARLPPEARYGVFEIGMNHAGEIRPLTRMVRPHVALVTQIAPAHIEYFPEGLAGIADAKAEIFEGLEPGGHAVINRDAPQAERLVARAQALGARVLTFGRHADATVRLLDLSLHATCSAVTAKVGRETLDYCLSLPGEHMAMNSLGVLAAAQAAGADVIKAAQAMAGLQGLKGRGQRQRLALAGGSVELIDDSYNANPVSMAAALAVLGQAKPGPGGRRIAVLGDMLELGAERDQLHAGLAAPLLAAGVDLLFACGPGMAALFQALPAEKRALHTADSAQLAPRLLAALRPGDVVLVKGSLGSRMARVIEALTQPPAAAVPA
jgi:UDP-N-acetylmuramoyl-tripeptide--D-alanyl-D-alanine ligase